MKKRNTQIIILAVIIIILIIPFTRNLISKATLKATAGVKKIASNSAFSSRGLFRGLYEIKDLHEKNEELNEKIKILQISDTEFNELKHENEVLKSQLGFVESHPEIELIPSKIIGREPTSYMDHISVDKGSDDGVLNGATVVSDGALVGKVVEVNSTTSKITLITSKNSVVQAMLQNSRVMGILRGGLSGITLENIPQDIEIDINEKVITSGLGGSMMQGILIGEVAGRRSSKSEIFKILNVTSQVDFSKIEIVFIIK